jgi:hypothetical protein
MSLSAHCSLSTLRPDSAVRPVEPAIRCDCEILAK